MPTAPRPSPGHTNRTPASASNARTRTAARGRGGARFAESQLVGIDHSAGPRGRILDPTMMAHRNLAVNAAVQENGMAINARRPGWHVVRIVNSRDGRPASVERWLAGRVRNAPILPAEPMEVPAYPRERRMPLWKRRAPRDIVGERFDQRVRDDIMLMRSTAADTNRVIQYRQAVEHNRGLFAQHRTNPEFMGPAGEAARAQTQILRLMQRQAKLFESMPEETRELRAGANDTLYKQKVGQINIIGHQIDAQNAIKLRALGSLQERFGYKVPEADKLSADYQHI